VPCKCNLYRYSTASRKKKRKAGYSGAVAGGGGDDDASVAAGRDAAAVANYPAPDPPSLDAAGFVLAFEPPGDGGGDDDDDAMAFFHRYGFVVFRGGGWQAVAIHLLTLTQFPVNE
jgi:hypothetical protein